MDDEKEELKVNTRPEDSEEVKDDDQDNGTDKNESVIMESCKIEDEESEKENASIETREERQMLLTDTGEPSQSNDNNEKDTKDPEKSFKEIRNFYESNDNAAQKEQPRQSEFDSTLQKEGLNQAICYTKLTTHDGSNDGKERLVAIETIDNGKKSRRNSKRAYLKCIILAGGILLIVALLITVILCFTTKQQESYKEEQFSGPQNDPFFSTAFPQKGSTVIIKCFLSFQGKYTLHTIFEKENKNSYVSDICSTGDEKHHYKLYCDYDHKTGCKDSTVCRNNCAKFNISLSEMDLILLEMDDSCLALNGRIEIWNSTIKLTR